MADRTVTVTLRAETGAFSRAMNDAAARARALGGDLNAGLAGENLTNLGGKITRNVTLPLAVAAGAAVSMAVKFDDAFRQMQGLAGVSADEVEGLKAAVLDLAGETAQAPQRLAEGLYFIRSAGIDGAAAMETLNVAARGATAGLGDVATVADAVTSALGAYGEANISAARAGDVLVATAREGKAEAAALAPQFGRILPIAAQLGVRFDEVGAGLAFLSRSGGGAELAATNLVNVLQKLLTPAEEGHRALEAIGLSTADLRASIAERGLLDTLVMLRSELEANGMELGDFSRDAQFTTGMLALTRDNGDAARAVFENLAAASGDLGEAFSAAAQGPGFEMRQAMAEIQAKAIEVGDDLAPMAASLMRLFSDVAGVLGALPGPAQAALLGLLGIAAASGPILTLVGHLQAVNAKLATMGATGATAARGLSMLGRIGGYAGAIAATGFALHQLHGAMEDLLQEGAPDLDRMGLALIDFGQQGAIAGELAATFGDDLRGLGDDLNLLADRRDGFHLDFAEDFDEAVARIDSVDKALAQLVDSGYRAEAEAIFNDLAAAAAAAGVPTDRLTAELGDYEGALTRADAQERLAADGAEELTTEIGGVAVSAEDAEKALSDYLDTLRASIDPFFALMTALDDNREAQAALDEAYASGTATLEELNAAQINAATSALDVEAAAVQLSEAMRTGSITTDGARAMLNRWVEQGLITRGTADSLAERIGLVSVAADRFDGNYLANLLVDDSEVWRINQASEWARAYGRTYVANLRVRMSQAGWGGSASGGYAGEGRYGPTDTIPTLLTPGEFVINARAAGALGPAMLHSLNAGQVPVAAVPTPAPAAGATVVVRIDGSGDRRFLDWLRNTVRVEGGGDVQSYLGAR